MERARAPRGAAGGQARPCGIPIAYRALLPRSERRAWPGAPRRAGRVPLGNCVRPSSVAADAPSEACGLSRGELSVRRRPLALPSSRSGWAWRACDRRAVDRRGRAVPPHASEDEGCGGPAEVTPNCSPYPDGLHDRRNTAGYRRRRRKSGRAVGSALRARTRRRARERAGGDARINAKRCDTRECGRVSCTGGVPCPSTGKCRQCRVLRVIAANNDLHDAGASNDACNDAAACRQCQLAGSVRAPTR